MSLNALIEERNRLQDRLQYEQDALNTCLALQEKIEQLESQLTAARTLLQTIVCTQGCDAGVVLLSYDGPTHFETIEGKRYTVYDHNYFSPLGDALMELQRILSSGNEQQPEAQAEVQEESQRPETEAAVAEGDVQPRHQGQ